jgi:hypothetical protein
MTPPRAYPGRDNRRILRRAKSLHRGTTAETNQRARCCHRPDHREVADAAIFTTRCENCGATI